MKYGHSPTPAKRDSDNRLSPRCRQDTTRSAVMSTLLTILSTSTQKSAMRSGSFCSGYRHSSHRNGTKVCEPIDLIAWETGYSKPVSLKNGTMRKMAALNEFCSVTGIRGWGKPMSGGEDSCLERNNVEFTNHR